MNHTIEQLQAQGDRDPNPFYGQSGNLSIILGEYYGMPHIVTSPLGRLTIDTPCVVDESWRPKVEEALGLKPVYGQWRRTKAGEEPVWSYIYSDGPFGGCQGPAWALLRDVDGNPLPETTTNITGWFLSGPVTPEVYTYDEALAIWNEHIAGIFA